jgi:hypothetical protein
LKDEPDDVSVRVVDPAGWPWAVHRRWLPWRPRAHRWVAVPHPSPGGGHAFNFVTSLLLSAPLVVVEWVLLLGLLPVAVSARVLGWRWTVTADGRRVDGTRVRYGARAGRWASGRLRDTVAAEIRDTGAPASLGCPVAVRVAADDVTDRWRSRWNDGVEVTVACLVQGYGTATSRDGWIDGRLTAVPGLLSFRTGGGPTAATWPLLGSDDPDLALSGPADHAAVGMRVIASYATPTGRFRVAVDPHLGPLLRDLLGAGAAYTDSAQQAWAMWRQDSAGAVREIARFGSRADAELLAENLAARGSRQRVWLAAARP